LKENIQIHVLFFYKILETSQERRLYILEVIMYQMQLTTFQWKFSNEDYNFFSFFELKREIKHKNKKYSNIKVSVTFWSYICTSYQASSRQVTTNSKHNFLWSTKSGYYVEDYN